MCKNVRGMAGAFESYTDFMNAFEMGAQGAKGVKTGFAILKRPKLKYRGVSGLCMGPVMGPMCTVLGWIWHYGLG